MKKLLLLLLVLCLAVPVFAMTACGDDEPAPTPAPAPGPAPEPPACAHVDSNYDDLCDDCGQALDPHKAKLEKTYTITADGHYKKATCCDAHKNAPQIEDHVDLIADGICDICGYDSNVPVEYCTVTVIAKDAQLATAGTYQVNKGVALTAAQVAEIKGTLYNGRGFDKFYTDEACTAEFDFTVAINENITLYATYGVLAGPNITWSHEGTTLTLTGSGDMFNFKNLNAVPWKGLTVNNVVFNGEITSIGDYAFYIENISADGSGMSIPAITIPEGIKYIGNYSFYGEQKLTEIKFPASLEVIGEHAFRNCTGLTYIDIGGKNLKRVEKSAFAQCSSAEYVIFNSAIEGSAQVFESCTKITRAFFAGNKGQYESLDVGYGNTNLTLAYMFFYTSYEPKQAGPYWYRNETTNAPEQWCWSLNYVSSDGNLSAIARDFVFVKEGANLITQDNIDFRNNIWHNGFQFTGWGSDKFEVGTKITKNYTFKGVRGAAVGDGVDYNITGNTLTISGSGKMWDFELVGAAPWHEGSKATDVTNNISEIIIGSNVTYIGDYAFTNFPALESVEIKSNIVEMSTTAFYGSSNLKYIYYYGNELEAMNCKGLQNQVDLPNLVVYCKEMAKDNVCDTCAFCMGEHEDELCDLCGLCATHVDANEDKICDVCGTCFGVEHVDEHSLSGRCFVCNVCLTHDETADGNEDGKCDVCGACVAADHVDAGETPDGKCDNCGACVGTDHVDKDGRCDICVTCMEHKDADANGECDVCKKCSGEHTFGLCDICGGCMDHVDEKCDTCKICREHTFVESVCTVCGTCETHVDDGEGKCSKCGACITCVDEVAANGKCQKCSSCIAHRDANKDGKCDICADCIECKDADNDKKCDVCKGCMPSNHDGKTGVCADCGECITHTAGTDELCTECGACVDGNHVNKDNKCDVCKKCIDHTFGKCDICARCEDEQHADENNDGKCDDCKACLNHVDSDVTYLTGKGVAPTISYWKDIEVAEGEIARITWQFDKTTGTLTVGGEGVVKDYASLDETPWAQTFSYVSAEGLDLGFDGIVEDVKAVVIRDGITSIGNNLFAGLENVETITIPDGVRRISATAFTGTKAIGTEAYDANGLLIINNHLIDVDPAKAGNRVLIPTNIITVADGAFDGCDAITSIRIPGGIMGATEASYAGLTNLKDVFIHGIEAAWINNPTKNTLPKGAQLYFFSQTEPKEEGYFWTSLNDPKIWTDKLPK